MSETKTIESLKSAAGLEARVLHNGTYWAVVRAMILEGKDGVEAFGLFMVANGGTGRDAYIAVRDDLRACLRSAQHLQRALRGEEIRLKAEGLGNTQERRSAYNARIRNRRLIRLVLGVRAAGKIWSKGQRAAEK